MSNALTTMNPAQLPAAFHSLMQQMQGSELSENVGASYAVVSIKGKVFRIKHGGTETPITMQFNGQTYAKPYMDVVIPMANPALSKTWYPSGYTEGSDESPTCWAEDGRNPLAPLEQRPKLANGMPCHDCQLCPMNVFGSKINEATGAKGKACSDTRKLAIIPVGDDGVIDFENARFGGEMLLRVPAASLQPFAEYDRKLQSMGLPYFGVVTRIAFDQSVAYPKLEITPVRIVTDAEAQQIIAARVSARIEQVIGTAHAASPQLPAPSVQPDPYQALAQQVQANQQAPAPVPQPVEQHQPAPVQAAPSNVIPMPAPAPATAAPVAPPVPQQPAPVQQAPAQPPMPSSPAPAPAMAPAPAPAPAPHGAFVAQPPPAAAMAPPAPAPAAAPQGEAAPTVSPELLGRIDQLLDS